MTDTVKMLVDALEMVDSALYVDDSGAFCLRSSFDDKKLQEALAAASNGGWMPIESAPKDGTPILAISKNAPYPSPDIAHWSDEDRCFRGGYQDDWASLAARGFKTWFDAATHWQPLPTPPKDTP